MERGIERKKRNRIAYDQRQKWAEGDIDIGMGLE